MESVLVDRESVVLSVEVACACVCESEGPGLVRRPEMCCARERDTVC
jgi:hypothetical protein